MHMRRRKLYDASQVAKSVRAVVELRVGMCSRNAGHIGEHAGARGARNPRAPRLAVASMDFISNVRISMPLLPESAAMEVVFFAIRVGQQRLDTLDTLRRPL